MLTRVYNLANSYTQVVSQSNLALFGCPLKVCTVTLVKSGHKSAIVTLTIGVHEVKVVDPQY